MGLATFRKLSAFAAALMVVLLAVGAAAEPLRIQSKSTLTTEGGSVLQLPAKVIIVEEVDYKKLDDELRRLQDAETRLAAENASLRLSAPGNATWGTIVAVTTAFAIGATAGWYAHDLLSR